MFLLNYSFLYNHIRASNNLLSFITSKLNSTFSSTTHIRTQSQNHIHPPSILLIHSPTQHSTASSTPPPPQLCTRGRVHIFKRLEMIAAKEDKKRGILSTETEFRKTQLRKPSSCTDFRCVCMCICVRVCSRMCRGSTL